MSPKENQPQVTEPLLEVQNLVKQFSIKGGLLSREVDRVHAVDGISFDIKRGETLGLVGESGCGKSTTGRLILRLLEPTSGSIRFKDQEIAGLDKAAMRRLRRHLQIIFQDPYASLNPRMTIAQTLGEPLALHAIAEGEAADARVRELLGVVGLLPEHASRYPHQFSGGQRQRIGIARALALKPDLVICDEPVSALDVSIQAQVLNLLKDLQEKLGLTYLFISHNLAVVDYIADRIMVMCAGQVVEVAPCGVLFSNPLDLYTKPLLTAVPEPNPDYRLAFDKLMSEKASKPSAWPAPFTVSESERPGLIDMGEGHFVRASKTLAAA